MAEGENSCRCAASRGEEDLAEGGEAMQEGHLALAELTSEETGQFEDIKKRLERIAPGGIPPSDVGQHREYFRHLRELLHLFAGVVSRANELGRDLGGPKADELRELAGDAILQLGGEAEPSSVSLKDYDHHLHGPFLGVSDEGSAVDTIRRAALASPKVRALGLCSPIEVGVAHDAERLAAVGEVAVGPLEYRDIRLGCHGSILTSTNVGTRLNLRYYKMRPVVCVINGSIEEAIETVGTIIEPFWRTPNGVSRPCTVFALFRHRTRFDRRRAILKALNDSFTNGGFCDPRVHKLGLLASVGASTVGVRSAMRHIDLAKEVGIAEVAIRGVTREEAEDKISMPGLLNCFTPRHATRLTQYAAGKGISITPINLVDTETVARNVWAGLQAARNMGLELGKYGLFPLTMVESKEVIELIQDWFSSWTAAPVFYVDMPAVGADEIYTEERIAHGAREWLDIIASNGVPAVLFDTADKPKGRRLLKRGLSDRIGIMTLDEVRELDEYASAKGIKCLWAGGITLNQALEFGKLGVFGIYVTSSAAALMPVSAAYERDPMITAEKEPTFAGVSSIKLLLEAGFLFTRLKEYGHAEKANELDQKAKAFLSMTERWSEGNRQRYAQEELASVAREAWITHYRHVR